MSTYIKFDKHFAVKNIIKRFLLIVFLYIKENHQDVCLWILIGFCQYKLKYVYLIFISTQKHIFLVFIVQVEYIFVYCLFHSHLATLVYFPC